MMKNYYFFLCVVVCCFFSSCDEDEKEAIPPVVTISSPDASVKLKRSVMISATATDDSGISSIQILVDETRVHDSADDEVSYEWNTETVTNGAHTITVVATDAVGNEATENLSVEVFNDKTAPQVTLTAPATQPFIKTTVKIEGSVVDDSAIESIKIFDGDVLLTTLTNTKSFSFDWDTKTVSDGNHTIKVTAIDNQGNETSVTKDVKVFNYFTTINIVNPEVPSHIKLWYLISKYDGTLIGAKEYVSGENKIRFETPDNYNPEERYVFSVVEHAEKFQGFFARTYYTAEVGFKPGEITRSPRFLYSISGSSDVQGYHNVKINNVPAHDHFYINGVNMYSSTTENTALDIKIGFYDFNNNNLSPTIAVLRSADEAPRFKKFTGLQIGGVTETNFDDFTPMAGKKILADPSAIYTYDYVYGVTASKYNESSPVWNYTAFSQPTKAHYLYSPTTGYPEYIFNAQEGTSTESNFYAHVGAEAPATFQRINASLSAYTKTQRTINAQITGEYDYFSLSGSMNKGTGEDLHIYFWSVQFPDGNNHSITLPQLPAALATYNFPDLATVDFGTANFSDYIGINGYQAMINFIAANPNTSLYSASKDFVFQSKMLPNSGGRLKDEALRQNVNLTMENMKRNGLLPNSIKPFN